MERPRQIILGNEQKIVDSANQVREVDMDEFSNSEIEQPLEQSRMTGYLALRFLEVN